MRFSDPQWLLVALAVCAAIVLIWWRYDARQRRALERFIAARLRVSLTRSVSPWRRRAQRLLLLGAFAALCTALAGPQRGFFWEQQSSRGNEIVFALDTSRSMLTADVKPNRLTRAKLAIADFVSHLDGDAVGIVAFAGTAFLVNPITLDYAAFQESLGAIDTETIPRGGTNIASAIREADLALHRRRGGEKIMILLTDGENLEGDAVAAAAAAGRDGLKIYTVGVGTPAGDLIPLPTALGGGFVKDDSGAFIKSHLDEPALQAIAAAAGGFYVPLGAEAEGLETIFTKVLSPLAKQDLAFRQQKIYIERFQWPLAAALAMLLLSLMIGTRRHGTARRAAPVEAATVASVGTTAAAGLGAAAGASLLLILIAPLSPMRRATAQQPEAALESGAADYRAGRFPQAAHAFQQSITQTPSDAARRLAEQQDAYYNLGNTLYRTGQKTEQSSRDETLKQWRAAVQAYDTALQLRPDDADSKYNRNFVQRKIDALEQQNGGGGNSPKSGGGGGQPPGGPPPSARQPPPSSQSHNTGQPPPAGQSPSGGSRPPETAAANAAPSTMSAEEARELLDSAKGDERHALGGPHAPTAQAPDKPFKNW